MGGIADFCKELRKSQTEPRSQLVQRDSRDLGSKWVSARWAAKDDSPKIRKLRVRLFFEKVHELLDGLCISQIGNFCPFAFDRDIFSTSNQEKINFTLLAVSVKPKAEWIGAFVEEFSEFAEYESFPNCSDERALYKSRLGNSQQMSQKTGVIQIKFW